MSRFVVLEFDNNQAAERFVQHMEASFDLNATSVALAHADVKWVFARPTLFCDCDPEPKRVKSARYGWWVCTRCRKPGPNWGTERGLRSLLTSAKDLKDAITTNDQQDQL